MKKNIFVFLCILLVVPSLVFATWSDDFLVDYEKLGIDRAVEKALANNIPPSQIISLIVGDDDVNNKETLKALYCAGANRDDVYAAAKKLGISEREIANALEESIAECSAPMVLDDRDNTGVLASPSTPEGDE